MDRCSYRYIVNMHRKQKKPPKLMHVADNQRIFKMSMEVHQIVQFMTLGLI